MPKSLDLTCVTVCVHYDDFLALTAPRNKAFFRQWIVVTTPGDTATQKVCARHGLTCHQTDVFYRNGDKFNKGAALNEAIRHFRPKNWVLFLDSDIILPEAFPEALEPLGGLERSCLYGASRRFVNTYDEYLGYTPSSPKIDDGIIGFFQMLHASALATYSFVEHSDASRYDLAVRKYFAKRDSVRMLPLVVTHLGPTGRNWEGRVTARFDTPIRDV